MRRWWIALAMATVVLAIALKLGVCDCGSLRAQALPSSLWVAAELRGWLCRILTISGLIMVAPGFTMVGAFVTAYIIWSQAGLLRAQNELHAIIELQKEWNSERMLTLRSAWAVNEGDIERLEPILEFLEDFARFEAIGY